MSYLKVFIFVIALMSGVFGFIHNGSVLTGLVVLVAGIWIMISAWSAYSAR